MTKSCKLNIITSADGTETSFVKDAKMRVSENDVSILYNDEEAEVSLHFFEGGAEIIRRGDYSLELYLKTGEETDGALGISGARGSIRVFTHRADYRAGENSIVAMLDYVLLMSGEEQKMKLRLAARGNASEEK